MEPILYTQYKTTVVPALKEELKLRNIMQVPKIQKITINVGYGRQLKDKAHRDLVEQTLTRITGQKPVHNKIKKSISNFKVREGQEVGASVVLRGAAMYEFLYRLIHITLPRVRDFRGLTKKGIDSNGNYSIGFKEHVAFPEVMVESMDQVHGLMITVTTTARSKDEATRLLTHMGFPFKDK